MIVKPRRCPFCGYDDLEIQYLKGHGPLVAWVFCTMCEAQGPHESIPVGMSEEEAAIRGWNDREPWEGDNNG